MGQLSCSPQLSCVCNFIHHCVRVYEKQPIFWLPFLVPPMTNTAASMIENGVCGVKIHNLTSKSWLLLSQQQQQQLEWHSVQHIPPPQKLLIEMQIVTVKQASSNTYRTLPQAVWRCSHLTTTLTLPYLTYVTLSSAAQVPPFYRIL